MLDPLVRRLAGPGLDRVGAALARHGIRPMSLTCTGFVAGVGAAIAAGTTHWATALVLWLVNRLLDALDGPVARHTTASALGGFADIVADFTVYAGFVVGMAVAVPDARLACVALLATYYVSGTAFLALSSLLERRRAETGEAFRDERSLRFVTGLAEGTETVLAYVLFCLFPGQLVWLVWAFAAAVACTAIQRVTLGVRLLHSPA